MPPGLKSRVSDSYCLSFTRTLATDVTRARCALRLSLGRFDRVAFIAGLPFAGRKGSTPATKLSTDFAPHRFRGKERAQRLDADSSKCKIQNGKRKDG